MKSVITDTIKNKILLMFNEGYYAPTIFQSAGISESTLNRFLKKNNLSLSKRKNKKHAESYDYDLEIGKRYNHLLIIGKKYNDKNSIWNVETKCDCGEITKSTLRVVKMGYKKTCGKNTCEHHLANLIRNAKYNNFTGHEEINGSFWSHYKLGAGYRNVKFNLDIKDAWELFVKQDKKCALSGIPLEFHYKNRTASLDRIDSSGGYTIDNVQWVHKDINKMKMDLKESDFIKYCKLIAKNM